MIKLQIISCLLTISIIRITTQLHYHKYYALQNTDVVSSSESIKFMNKCKDDCLTMGKKFPFKFKFHRYVLRQKQGNNKYFQGTCHFATKQSEDTWYDWADLQIFITDTSSDILKSQVLTWSEFQQRCEDQSLKIDEISLQSMGFTRVHSNFQYYENGTFVNLQPFDDIDKMLGDLSGYIS